MSESKTFKTLRQSLLIAVTSATFLVGCGQPDSMSTSDIVSETSSTLDLNDTQARKIARVVDTARPELEVLKEIRVQLREEMLAQMQQDSVNMEDVNALLEANWASVHAKLPALAQKFTDFHTMLTPEQRSKVKERMSKGWKTNDLERLESSNTSRIVFGMSIALDLDDIQEQEMTRYDAVNFIAHGVSKNPNYEETKELEDEDHVAHVVDRVPDGRVPAHPYVFPSVTLTLLVQLIDVALTGLLIGTLCAAGAGAGGA